MWKSCEEVWVGLTALDGVVACEDVTSGTVARK